MLRLLLLALLASAVYGEISTSEIDADKRPIILFDTFGFDGKGHVDITVSDVTLELPEDKLGSDKSLLGFFIATAEAELSLQEDFQEGRCVMDDPHVYKLFTLKDAADAAAASGASSSQAPYTFNFSVPDAHEYSLFFANCQRHIRVTMNVKFSLYNIDSNGKADYLPAGKTQLPLIYLVSFLAFMAVGIAWVYLCYVNKANAHRVHVLMAVLVFFKALTALSQAGEYAYIKATGAPHGWNIAYYVFSAVRGIMLFTVIVLIGTGWSFLKPFLQDREKKVIMIVIPLQVFANIAVVILDESGPSAQSWLTWRDIFHLLDIVCCCAILFPIVWSIKSLREAAQTDGKAARNMMKLQLFRQFYIMVVCYIYFTRIIVYLLRSTTAYHLAWTADVASEAATFAFYCATGWMFRPMDQNPYLVIDEEEEEAAAQALKDEDDFDF